MRKDLRWNPCVLSCFTCLGWLSSFLCTYKPLGCRPPMTLRFFCFFFAVDCYLQLTFLCDRICRLKALPHRVQNVVWQEWDSNPRTHVCTRILDWGNSWVWRLRPLGHPAWFTSTFFLYDMRFFNWVDFAYQRFSLLNGLCQPSVKICL